MSHIFFIPLETKVIRNKQYIKTEVGWQCVLCAMYFLWTPAVFFTKKPDAKLPSFERMRQICLS